MDTSSLIFGAAFFQMNTFSNLSGTIFYLYFYTGLRSCQIVILNLDVVTIKRLEVDRSVIVQKETDH